MEIKLGSKVKDLASGLTGIAVSRVEYINGCVQYAVQPASVKNEMPEAIYFDEKRLSVIGKGISIESKPTGGLMRDVPRR